MSDLTRAQLCKTLNISDWILRQLEEDGSFPRIQYNSRVIRYNLEDVMHYREGKKRGGWIQEAKEAA